MGYKTLYSDGNIITGKADIPFLANGWILTDGNRIAAVGSGGQLPAADRTVNLHGWVLAPGMISTHGHFYGQFTRGISLNQPMCNWQQVLSRMWWKLDKMLEEKQVYYSAMMGLVEGLKAGTTTYFDHHASPNFISGSQDAIENAMLQVGGRGCFAYEVTDRDGPERAALGIEENIRYIEKHKKDESRFKGMFGLHASYTLSDQTLEQCAHAGNALGSGFHTHLAESAADVCDGYRRCDMHVAERMERYGILGGKTIAAHCVHMRPAQFALLYSSDTTVAHNCQSNTNNAVGVCPVAPMMESGVSVTIGGDGYTYDLFTELGFALIMQRLNAQDPSVLTSRRRVLELMYGNSQRLAERIFGYPVGAITPGAAADFLILDYDPPTNITEENFLLHIGAFSGHVHTVIVDGETVVQAHKCTKVDEEEIFAKCRELSSKLWAKAK